MSAWPTMARRTPTTDQTAITFHAFLVEKPGQGADHVVPPASACHRGSPAVFKTITGERGDRPARDENGTGTGVRDRPPTRTLVLVRTHRRSPAPP
ncbi:hypothetical protein SMD44_08663 [Streptomyces alboflavus]|uniref:Uncharacterized protein n=1 Tax=Streptomyces alboflavus TaxID=67267 RepID=A0A1Z1WRW7_9ACTN|nr:hypothetical protein SMD44_08663 [Streptomyces alboflavus]